MTYARIENNNIVEYPIYEGDIRLLYSNISFPTPFVPPEGYVQIHDVQYPSDYSDYRKNVSEGIPLLVDGKWFRNWVVTDATTDEIIQRTNNQWNFIRADRNARLTASDWVVTKSLELGEAVPQSWLTYRQALRDITLQEDPFNIVWPTPPE